MSITSSSGGGVDDLEQGTAITAALVIARVRAGRTGGRTMQTNEVMRTSQQAKQRVNVTGSKQQAASLR